MSDQSEKKGWSIALNAVFFTVIVFGTLSSWLLPKDGLDKYDRWFSWISGSVAAIVVSAIWSAVAIIKASKRLDTATATVQHEHTVYESERQSLVNEVRNEHISQLTEFREEHARCLEQLRDQHSQDIALLKAELQAANERLNTLLVSHEHELMVSLDGAANDAAHLLSLAKTYADRFNIVRATEEGNRDPAGGQFLVSIGDAAQIEAEQLSDSRILIVNPDLQIEERHVNDPCDRRKKITFATIVRRNIEKGVVYLFMHHHLETQEITAIRKTLAVSEQFKHRLQFLPVPGDKKDAAGPHDLVSELVKGLMTSTITIYNFGSKKPTVLITPPDFFTDFAIGLPEPLANAVHEALKRYVDGRAT